MITNSFDNTTESVTKPQFGIETLSIDKNDVPDIAITCFSANLFEKMIADKVIGVIAYFKSSNGTKPIYLIEYKGVRMVAYMSPVGSPVCIGAMEEVASLGIKKFLVFGTCGVLYNHINTVDIIVPTSAIRDEGTSYHYAAASDEIKTNYPNKDVFKSLVNNFGFSFYEGKVWTTDAFYRETVNNVQKRKEQGCICVDMECSAITAFAQFYNIDIFQFFYAADSLADAEWDKRSLGNNAEMDKKMLVADLALEMCTRM